MKKISIAVLILSASLSACFFESGERIEGNGENTSVERKPGSFTGVEQKGPFDVELRLGEAAIKLEGESNILDKIETDIDGSMLHIRTASGYNLNPGRKVKIVVTAPYFTAIESFGSGNIVSDEAIKTDEKVTVETRGSGDVRVQLVAPEISGTTNGSGDISLAGETRKLSLECNGSGDLNAGNLKAEEVKVEIRGSGNASVYASKTLKVDVMGSGDVKYAGSPSIESNFKGSGNLRKAD